MLNITDIQNTFKDISHLVFAKHTICKEARIGAIAIRGKDFHYQFYFIL